MNTEHLATRDDRLAARQDLWDEAFSTRHRTWGEACAAYDVDHVETCLGLLRHEGMLFMEAHYGKVVALVEYKHVNALSQKEKYAMQCQTLSWLADGRSIPAFCCYYDPDSWELLVCPLNTHAKRCIPHACWVSELQWVKLLHALRGKCVPAYVQARLHRSVKNNYEKKIIN